jgi:tetratricopeptide (TPR) repeat protein
LSAVRIREAIQGLTAVADDPVVGLEAHLHLGVLYFHLNRLAESRVELDRAQSAADSFVSYLARLMLGQLFEIQNQPADAELSYRSALAIRPDAPSGLSALGALLFLADRREEATSLYRRMVSTHPSAPDPWREYGFGSFRFWQQYIQRLRKEVWQ